VTEASPLPSTVIFISGYGRSGSTVLDMLLSSRLAGVFGAGEIGNLFDELELGSRCECGSRIADCAVWSPVVGFVEDEAALRRAREVTIRGDRIVGQAGPEYFNLWRAVLSRLKAATGCDVIVDSSKVTRTRFRHAARLRAMGVRLVVLHLVRDPEDVVAASREGSNKAIERGEKTGGSLHVLRSIVGWLVGNLGTEHLVRRTGAPRRLVRYELLVESEEYRQALLAWVAEQAGVKPNGSSGPLVGRGHGVSGNRLRRMGSEPIELRRVRAARPKHPLDRATAGLLRVIGRALGYYETARV
jgi:hypothetical protein